ncbi:MAG: cytochrome c-type biogenesis protein CcmH [Gemmatimonadales bacterium]|nr:cytochrome c-type biogenesis protein CcmH [Gemmatimonadales bacterium]
MGTKVLFRQGRRVATLVVLAVPLFWSTGSAQQAIDKAANEIFGSVMSPFCPGMTIATCPSSEAADLRVEVRNRLAAGATKQEVLDELYAVWGEEVLGPAPTGGLGVFAWLVPGGVMVLGAAMLTVWLRSSSRRYGGTATASGVLDPEAQRRLEQELAQI